MKLHLFLYLYLFCSIWSAFLPTLIVCVFVRCVCYYHLCELLCQHFNFPLWMNNLLYRSIFIYLCITIDPSAIHTSLHLSIVHQSIDVSFPSKMSSHSRSFPHPLSLILSLSLALSLSVALSGHVPLPLFPLGVKSWPWQFHHAVPCRLPLPGPSMSCVQQTCGQPGYFKS